MCVCVSVCLYSIYSPFKVITHIKPSSFQFSRTLLIKLYQYVSNLPTHAPKAATPQPTADASLSDPGQVITVEDQVVPFFSAQGGGDERRKTDL